MLTKVLRNNHHTNLIVALAWVIVGTCMIWWLVRQITQTPVLPDINKKSNLLEIPQLLKAAEFLDENQLTTHAPSATLNSQPASPEAEIDETLD